MVAGHRVGENRSSRSDCVSANAVGAIADRSTASSRARLEDACAADGAPLREAMEHRAWLETEPNVESVSYPGLEKQSAPCSAKKQMRDSAAWSRRLETDLEGTRRFSRTRISFRSRKSWRRGKPGQSPRADDARIDSAGDARVARDHRFARHLSVGWRMWRFDRRLRTGFAAI